MLKPQDILVLLKLVALGGRSWSYNEVAMALAMSPSEVHAALRRAVASGLAVRIEKRISPNVRNLEEFLLHGLRYAFAPERGELTRGVPTAHAALSLEVMESGDPPPVWPDPDGEERGIALRPLYRSVPEAARNDRELHQLLALVDSIRIGRARERALAEREISRRLEQYASYGQPQY